MSLPPRQVAILEVMRNNLPITIMDLRIKMHLKKTNESNIRMNVTRMLERGMLIQCESTYVFINGRDQELYQYRITKAGHDALYYHRHPNEKPPMVKKDDRSLWKMTIYKPKPMMPARAGALDHLSIRSVGMPT